MKRLHVAAAVIRIGQKALRNPVMNLVGAAAFVSIFLVHAPFPFIVLSAGVIGLVVGPIWPGTFLVPSEHPGEDGGGPALTDDGSAGDHTDVSVARTVKVLAIGLLAWFGPLLLLAPSVHAQIPRAEADARGLLDGSIRAQREQPRADAVWPPSAETSTRWHCLPGSFTLKVTANWRRSPGVSCGYSISKGLRLLLISDSPGSNVSRTRTLLST